MLLSIEYIKRLQNATTCMGTGFILLLKNTRRCNIKKSIPFLCFATILITFLYILLIIYKTVGDEKGMTGYMPTDKVFS